MYISASQINKFLYSPRRWALEYIFKYKQDINHHAEYGKLVHTKLEDLLKNKPSDVQLDETSEETIADALKGPLGDLIRRGDWDTELDIRFDLDGAATLVGRVDGILTLPGFTYILDHKVISNTRYAETAETIRDNLQLRIYLAWSYQHRPHLHLPDSTITATFIHNQLIKNPKNSIINTRLVEHAFLYTPEDFESLKSYLLGIANKMKQIKELCLSDRFYDVEIGKAKSTYYGKVDSLWPYITLVKQPTFN